jgi:hypothetical protein
MTLPIIERRRIEAEILKHVFDVVVESHGKEIASKVVSGAVSRSAIDQGAHFREALGRTPDLVDFAAIQQHWTANDALTVEVTHASPERFEFNVTRCRYAELYRDMGLAEIGPLLSCARDGEFCTGYNPEIKLTRTQTLMIDGKPCDFRYKLDKGQE